MKTYTAYELRIRRPRSLMQFMKRRGDDPDIVQALRYIAERRRYTKGDLYAYGYDDSRIERMVERGTLIPVEVSWNEYTGIGWAHRYRTDPDYRSWVFSNLQKAWKNAPSLERKREYADKARRVKDAPVRKRRKKLLREVIIPEFGVPQDDGTISIAEGIYIVDVVAALDSYPDLLGLYPEDVYMAVMGDIHSLCIPQGNKSEKISATWKEKKRTDPELVVMLKERVKNATAARLRLYEEYPERQKTASKRSARTRSRKMNKRSSLYDPEFDASTRANLAKGPSALWDKYESDAVFREEFRAKQMAHLRQGNLTSQKRAERRRKALLGVIESRFGGLDEVTGPGLTKYLSNKRPGFVRRYYSGNNIPSLVKKDLRILRESLVISSH